MKDRKDHVKLHDLGAFGTQHYQARNGWRRRNKGADVVVVLFPAPVGDRTCAAAVQQPLALFGDTDREDLVAILRNLTDHIRSGDP